MDESCTAPCFVLVRFVFGKSTPMKWRDTEWIYADSPPKAKLNIAAGKHTVEMIIGWPVAATASANTWNRALPEPWWRWEMWRVCVCVCGRGAIGEHITRQDSTKQRERGKRIAAERECEESERERERREKREGREERRERT